jgi:hypothetical protein
MKKLALISACIVAMSAGGALAQSQPAPGASSEGNVGPGAATGAPRADHMKKGTTGMGTTAQKPGMANPSSEGNVGPGTNNNSGKQPGGR